MTNTFRCVLVGRGPQLVACGQHLLRRGHRVLHVVSDCEVAGAFCQQNGIARVEPGPGLAERIGGEPFEYLFSVVNHSLTEPAVLALPARAAINYHDSMLPEYGGFHSTSWAILDGREQHGITWHRMTDEVDGGPYLVQRAFAIAEQDTAFSLAARAAETADRAFVELLEQLEQGRVAETPGQPARQFHRKSERPGFPVLDGSRPAAELSRLVRACDFAGEDNWFGRARLLVPSGAFVAVGTVDAAPASGAAAGTVMQVDGDGVVVAVADGALRFGGLATLEGEALDASRLAALGLTAGTVLPSPAALRDVATAFDLRATRCERFWVRRLQQLALPQLAELDEQAPAGAAAQVRVALPTALRDVPAERQRASLLAAVAGYLARVGEELGAVDVPTCTDLPAELHALYSPVAPARVALAADTTWQAAVEQAQHELQQLAERPGFARDVWQRYGALRGRARTMPLAVSLDGSSRRADGVRLQFAFDSDAFELVVEHDSAALSGLHAQRLADRVVHLLAAGLGAPATPVAQLPIVTDEERRLLLEAFQDTARDVPPACIQELFAAQVQRTPDATAVVCRDDQLTYRELDRRAESLAQHLRGLGVGRDRLVGIAIERSIDMVVGLLAILKAGGAYVPLDPAYPAERIAMMLEDSGARWLLTQRRLARELPAHGAEVVLVDEARPAAQASQPAAAGDPSSLAYVIFTSGSTGRPKGVMVEHRNVANFFAGMDERIGAEPGVWLAVTSISFDISVLELFWTLSRGFEVVIQQEADRASMQKAQAQARDAVVASDTPMDFSLFYFAADSTDAPNTDAYRLLLDGARFADRHGFSAVWTPERHFHAFGGLYPNPAVTSAAIAAITEKVELRAGSVVIPLHDPIRVAEEWAVVDNLSRGRVGLSFASGWHVNDFALQPQNYERRREVMQESIDTVLRLWAGEKVKRKNGAGEEIELSVLPRPVRARPPMWVASAGNIETFRIAGRNGYNILTNMLGQSMEDLKGKFAAYREARREAGHEGPGIVSVMLHTFVTEDDDQARAVARGPFGNYLKTSYDLVKVAPWMFPAFKQPSVQKDGGGADSAFDPSRFDDDDMAALLDHAFDRYFDTAGLFGTPQRALRLVEQLKAIGATEVACLVDFGIDPQVVLDNLVHLDELRRIANPGATATGAGAESAEELATAAPVSVKEQFARRAITHLQCTPSLARILLADGTLEAMGSLRRFMVGGEALPKDLAETITSALPDVQLINMYGPTETTVWSTTAPVPRGSDPDITIGTPIANTQIRILDARLELQPLGVAGELCIGGHSVVRGYLNRPELTAERFVADPLRDGNRLYRTGDLARYREDGTLEYLGRIDQQVKVNGYRIELGEIETVLQRHPAVEQAVCAVKGTGAAAQLVGYVIEGGAAGEAAADDTSDWRQRWDTAYRDRVGAAHAPARRNTSGWLSSLTGEPIDAAAMDEWLDLTVARVRELAPRRVLEIGCGTGMVLFGCLPHVEHYTALDQSPAALETIRAELSDEERRKVTLLQRGADQLDGIADGSVDVVVINSVAQYFPSVDYLLRVLEQAARVLADGGALFLGDVRVLEVAPLFHALVELHKAPGSSDSAELRRRFDERTAHDNELLLSQRFAVELGRRVPRLTLESMRGKVGAHSSEMRDFRSDWVLRAAASPAPLDLGAALRVDGPESLAAITQALEDGAALVHVTGARNAWLDRLHEAVTAVRQGADTSAEQLLESLQQAPRGIDPGALDGLHPDYSAEVRFAGDGATFEAVLRHRHERPAGVWTPTVGDGLENSNVPHRRSAGGETLAPQLRQHLRAFLPEYMVPQAFVTLRSLPLTPNGKIDRKALPEPSSAAPRAAEAEFAVPGNDMERRIAAIWQRVLGIERVGRRDNIFDLGASSLLTVEANSQLQQQIGQKIPLVTMFRFPTVESLAAHLAKTTDAAVGAAPATDDDRQGRLAAAAARRRQARARNS